MKILFRLCNLVRHIIVCKKIPGHTCFLMLHYKLWSNVHTYTKEICFFNQTTTMSNCLLMIHATLPLRHVDTHTEDNVCIRKKSPVERASCIMTLYPGNKATEKRARVFFLFNLSLSSFVLSATRKIGRNSVQSWAQPITRSFWTWAAGVQSGIFAKKLS